MNEPILIFIQQPKSPSHWRGYSCFPHSYQALLPRRRMQGQPWSNRQSHRGDWWQCRHRQIDDFRSFQQTLHHHIWIKRQSQISRVPKFSAKPTFQYTLFSFGSFRLKIYRIVQLKCQPDQLEDWCSHKQRWNLSSSVKEGNKKWVLDGNRSQPFGSLLSDLPLVAQNKKGWKT